MKSLWIIETNLVIRWSSKWFSEEINHRIIGKAKAEVTRRERREKRPGEEKEAKTCSPSQEQIIINHHCLFFSLSFSSFEWIDLIDQIHSSSSSSIQQDQQDIWYRILNQIFDRYKTRERTFFINDERRELDYLLLNWSTERRRGRRSKWWSMCLEERWEKFVISSSLNLLPRLFVFICQWSNVLFHSII